MDLENEQEKEVVVDTLPIKTPKKRKPRSKKEPKEKKEKKTPVAKKPKKPRKKKSPKLEKLGLVKEEPKPEPEQVLEIVEEVVEDTDEVLIHYNFILKSVYDSKKKYLHKRLLSSKNKKQRDIYQKNLDKLAKMVILS
jgi:hypothetical protein